LTPRGRQSCVRFFFAIFIVVGFSFLADGLHQTVQFGKYDPLADFGNVSGGCTIVSERVASTYRYGNRGQSREYRVFKYTFYQNSDPSIVVWGGLVDERTSDAPFEVGSTKPCWQRAPGVTQDFLLGFYSCENSACLKVANPASELESLTGMRYLWIGLGVVHMLVGICGAAMGVVLLRKLRREMAAAKPEKTSLEELVR
jgi:hypothetical protein